MNVHQLQPPPPSQLQRFSKEGSEKDADFLALRLLNKRSRLRLSPEPIQLDSLPGKGRLFAVANSTGRFAAATRHSDGSHALILAPLADLRSALQQSSSPDTLATIQHQVTIDLPAIPHILAFTHDGARLLVAFTNGPLSVYDSHALFQAGATSPLHTYPSSMGKPIREVSPSTGEAEHVAVLREPGDGLTVEILDVHKMSSLGGWNAGGSPGTNPTTLSWSPKGKQIAIGLESGDLVSFSPTDTSAVKSILPHPPSAEGQTAISTTWLSNTEYHSIYAPVGPLNPDVEQTHFILSIDPKANATGDVKLTSPYLPYPGLRPPGAFVIILRNWEPSRLLLFVGDSTSSDVGLIGSLSGSVSPLDSWYNLTLEETSTPSVPLDVEANDTVLLGLDLDLTDNQPFKYTGPSGEETEVPPPPVMFLYASDGTVTGWHIIQTQGVAYPGMAPASPASATSSATTPHAPQQNAFATSPAPATPSAFASTSPTTTTGGAFGFSAFSGAPSAFGSGSSFGGFGSQQPQQPPSQSPSTAPPMSEPTISVDMTSSSEDAGAETQSGFGGLSLGGGGTESKSNKGTNSMFGSFGASAQQPSTASAFGGGATTSSTFSAFGAGPVKPASGFGALSGTAPSTFGSSGAFGGGGGAFGQGSSAFGAKPATEGTTPSSTENNPASGFGQPGFGAAANPAFGQSSFGQSSFGQPSFGQSAFGQSSLGSSGFGAAKDAPKPASVFGSSSSSGGFASFASGGTSSFAAAAQKQATPDAKPAWASAMQPEQKPQESTNTPATGAFDQAKPTESTPAPAVSSTTTPGGAFGALGQANQSNPFGKTAFGQSSFGQSAFGQASNTPKPATSSAFGTGGGFASFANAGPSAFGAIAQQQDTKPVWAVSTSSDSGTTEQPKSAFGNATTPSSSSPFGTATSTGTSPFGASTSTSSISPFSASTSTTASPFGTTQPAAAASSASPDKPAPGPTTPPATPPVKPATESTDSATPKMTPAPTGGAFGGLTTSATGFSKLQSGFGAFGSTTPTASPFFSKPGSTSTTTPQTASVFGQSFFGAQATTTPADPSKPTFGAPSFGVPSAFGSFFGKADPSTPSPFGKPASAESTTSKPPTTPTTTPAVKSVFGAFSGSASPFGAAAAASGSGKSFGDLLRQKEGGEQDGETGKEGEKKGEVKGFSKTAEEWKKPVSVFASLRQAATKTPEKGKEEEEDAEGEEEEDEGADTSFRSHEEDEDEVDDGDDGIDAFLKSDEEDLGSDEEEGEDDDEDDDEDSSSQVNLGSPTVKQPTKPKPPPSIFSSPSPSPSKESEVASSKSTPVRERSTTPPGSPADAGSPVPVIKQSTAPVTRSTSAPPTSTPTSTSGGLLIPGRPSTRPVRSSPLASRPISGEEEEGEADDEADDEEKAASPSKKARSASPAIPVPGDKTSRPKTPPVLFGASVAPPKLAPFTLAPATAPTFTPPGKSPSPVAGKSAEPAKPLTPSASPAPSLSGPGTPGLTSLFSGAPPPVFTPPSMPSGGLFGQKPPVVGATAAAPLLFGQNPTTPASVFGSGSFFSAPPTPAPPKPASPAPPPPPTTATSATPSLFGGFGAPTPAAKPSLFGNASKLPPAPSTVPAFSAPPPIPSPQLPPAPAQDMQTEFTNLCLGLTKELEDLKVLAARASTRAAQLSKPGSGVKTSKDLSEPTKWVMSDLSQFTQIMKEVERELEKWRAEKATCVSYLRELESDMLKGTTRKEEIERFSKASKDTDFARMLKARILNPDHLETQSQLRREIRTIRNRLEQLEDYIQASKKKLNSVKKGKPSFKPPSLDTINRTYRNIDMAIEQEEEDVANLTDRLAKLETSSTASPFISTYSTRDKRLPERSRRVGREVTPNIAASTAAALNAEHSAQKLKRALLSTRKEPLLNTKAVDASPPERELHTPRKPLLAPGSGLNVGAAFAAGLNGGFPAIAAGTTPATPAFAWTPPPPGSIPSPTWSLPPFEPDASLGSSSGGGGGLRGRGPREKEKQHAKPIQLHTGQKPPLPPPPAGFSWGPVPVIKPRNTISIFAGLGGSGTKPKEEDAAAESNGDPGSLSSSWVADGFGESTAKK